MIYVLHTNVIYTTGSLGHFHGRMKLETLCCTLCHHLCIQVMCRRTYLVLNLCVLAVCRNNLQLHVFGSNVCRSELVMCNLFGTNGFELVMWCFMCSSEHVMCNFMWWAFCFHEPYVLLIKRDFDAILVMWNVLSAYMLLFKLTCIYYTY
jgi:hypothetical protein